MKNLSLIFSMIFLINCNSKIKYEYWEISQFVIENGALKDGENISLLYASRAPDYKNEDYYVHFVIVSDETGDTVNILSKSNHYINKQKDDGKNYVFHSANSSIAKIVETDFKNSEDSILDPKVLDKLQLSKFEKVIRDPSFDYIAKNNYPTVIGLIMKKMKDGESYEDFLN